MLYVGAHFQILESPLGTHTGRMDEFVQNLFEDIEIPEDIPDAEHIFTCPSKQASQVDSGHATIRSQTAEVKGPTIENAPSESPTLRRKPVVTTGLSLTAHNRENSSVKRPISDFRAPFIAPAPYKHVSDEPYKKHCDEPITLNSEAAIVSVPQVEHEQPKEKKTIAERYPLKGPAGLNVFSILSNVLMNGGSNDDGMHREGNSWVMAMSMLDKKEVGCDFKQYSDFPEHYSVSEYVTQKFNIRWIIKQASMLKFGFKIDWLVVFILSQRTMGMQVMYVLMDKSGQMLGYMSEALHTKLKHIMPGCTLILKHVSH